jgi:hypothetical protein
LLLYVKGSFELHDDDAEWNDRFHVSYSYFERFCLVSRLAKQIKRWKIWPFYKGIYPLAVWLRKKLSDDENGNRHTIISHLLSFFIRLDADGISYILYR